MSRRQSACDRVIQHLRQFLMQGRPPCGGRLPSVRALARRLHVSEETVRLAYGRLQADGMVESRPRVGYFICEPNYIRRLRHTRAAFRDAIRGPVDDAIRAGLCSTTIRMEFIAQLKEGMHTARALVESGAIKIPSISPTD